MATAIEWADESWNPFRARVKSGKEGWACEIYSPECKNCYAQAQNMASGKHPSRMGTGLRYSADNAYLIEHFVHEPTLRNPLKWKSPKRIFPCSMTDMFGRWVPDEWLDRVYAIMALTPQHTYIVLTKRAERRRDYLLELGEQDAVGTRITAAAVQLTGNQNALLNAEWPLPNVIEMASFGTQAQADVVAPVLAATPAARIGLSCEPLLEEVELPACLLAFAPATLLVPQSRRLSWLIVGGESGDSARSMDAIWARKLRRQAVDNQIPFFMKQLGRNVLEAGHRIKLRDRKGGDFEEFPDSLKWRQAPADREVMA